MKRKLLSLLVLLMTAVTGAWADDYTITLPTVSNGSVVAKVSDVSVTSAAAGATVTLVATPDAGYRLKTIGGTYQGAPQETLSKGAATRTGNYFTLTASNSVAAGWTLYSSSTITISRLDGGNISTVVLNITPRASFAFNEMSVNHGTSRGGAYGCVVNSAQITGTGTVDKALSLTSTGDDNVKTFTMPSGNVTVSAEFEEIPAPASYNVTANSADGAYWATFYSSAGNYQAPEGTQVFAVNLEGTGITMTEITDRIVKSGQGVVLKNSTTASITMTLTETVPAGDFSANSLKGTMTNITNPGNAYVLNYKAATGAGFYKLSASGTIKANKAYLTYSGSEAPLRDYFGFLQDETTGIQQTEAEVAADYGTVYDLQGRPVTNPAPGIYIVNGKKVFIK